MNALNPIFPQAASRADSTSGNNSAVPSSQGLNNMFLQLLVAQLKSQSPLNPMDPTQFVGQLAQFSELSEVTQIEQILQQAIPSKTASASTPASRSTNVPSGSPKNQESVPVPAAMASAAVAAAQAMVPNWSAPQASMLNSKIQGVF
jgi:flagellar basal-body rod modification protein FlgD